MRFAPFYSAALKRKIPVLGYVSAGRPDAADAHHLGYVTVPLPHTGGDLFGLVVRGDSMRDAGIRDGHIVLIRRQQTFADGDIVVASVDGQATLKRIYQHAGGYRLEAENPAYPALFLRADATWYAGTPRPPFAAGCAATEVEILGLMVGQLSGAVFPVE